MRNHHKELPEPVSTDKILQMNRGNDRSRVIVPEPSAALMQGHFRYLELNEGMRLHTADVTELQDAASSNEVKAMLSFNLLFRGEVEFSLGSEKFSLSNRGGGRGQVIALAVDRPELFTRYTKAGNTVHKLNLSVSREWITSRLASDPHEDLPQLLFNGLAHVHQWDATDTLCDCAERILVLCAPDNIGFDSRLALEIEAHTFLREAISMFRKRLVSRKYRGKIPQVSTDQAPADLMGSIHDGLLAGLTLEQLARQQGMSVSTLQRHFKTRYGVTVMDYARRQKLERARSAMLFEGLTVAEAAYAAGYNHPSNFIAAFKREYQMTPSNALRFHR